jgi:short-subunit dehydrogenase
MKFNFEGKSVIIIGASGGLGSSFAKAFAGEGARVLLAGRNETRLKLLASRIGGETAIGVVDITSGQSVTELAELAKAWCGEIDILVNASGYDARKSLLKHSLEEIRESLDTNLLGAVLLTQAFLPLMKQREGSIIIHIGGFADERLAFPYYSVDVASRAGVFSFVEAMNRELELEGSKVKVGYFCPSPAETDAERPFHPLWKRMNIQILPVEKVAEGLLKMIAKRRTVSIMGGMVTVLFAKLNSIKPKLADRLMMKSYGKLLKEFLSGTEGMPAAETKDRRKGLLNELAAVLIILSFLLYGLGFLIPFLPLSLSRKAVMIPVSIALGEAVWWIGMAILGKQVITKYRKCLNPCGWFRCRKTTRD